MTYEKGRNNAIRLDLCFDRELAGDRSNVINVASKPSVKLIWAVVVYDLDTRCLITSDQQRA